MRKTASLGFLLLGLGCGDTYEETYIVGGAGQDSPAGPTCENIPLKLYNCNYKDAQNRNGYIEGAIEECETQDLMTQSPEMMQCYWISPCEKLLDCEKLE